MFFQVQYPSFQRLEVVLRVDVGPDQTPVGHPGNDFFLLIAKAIG